MLSKRKSKKIIPMRRKRNRAAKIGGLLLLIIVTLLVLMLTPFFNIKWIDIKGSSKVTSGEIKTAIAYKTEENIFRINLRKGTENLKQLPYVLEASLSRKLPDGIRVTITERVPVAGIAMNGSYVLIDEKGRLLEQVTKAPEKLPLITGIDIKGLKLGQFLTEKDEERGQAFFALYQKLVEYEFNEHITSIDIKDVNDLHFVYENNKKVVLGDGYKIDYKFMMLRVAIDELAPSEKGTITLSVEGKAIFTPEQAQ